MKNNPIISIIVPVYQVKPYLKECLDSILIQSFTDWEMLLIDDGSTDGSELICDEYGLKDSRIRVFHKENEGLSSARNLGLDHSRGEFITLFDSDDVMLTSEFLRILYDAIIEHDADISLCKAKSFFNGSALPEADLSSDKYELLSGRDIFVKEPYCENVQTFSMAQFKLYRRTCFDHIRYPVGRVFEDLAVFHHIYYERSKIVLLDKYMCGRRFRTGSIIQSTKGSIQYQDMLQAIDNCISYLEEKKDDEAVSYAKLRKSKHIAYCFFKALKDGTIDEISSDIRPSIKDFEDACSHEHLLISLRDADPECKSFYSKEYLSLLANRTFQLLRSAYNYLLNNSTIDDLTPAEISRLYKLAKTEEMLSLSKAAFNERNDHHLLQSTKQYILLQNEWNKIKEFINLNVECPLPIPLLPTKLISLYKQPWLRSHNSQYYLIDYKNIDTIKYVMNELGYETIPSDPLESDRLYSISFENKHGIVFNFIYNVPFYLLGNTRKYLEELFQTMRNNEREPSLLEFLKYIVLKLHLPNIHSTSACTSDLLDLILILHNNPTLSTYETFIQFLNDYSLNGHWKMLESIYQKVISNPSIVLDEIEQNYLKELIRRPFLRTTFLLKYSSNLLKHNKLQDPIEYTVSNEKQIAYLVNSKAACSSIKASIIGDDTATYNNIHRITMRKGASRRQLSTEEQFYFKFTFVRNPFSRLVSCYKNKYYDDKELFTNDYLYRDYLLGYLYDNEGFDRFVQKICALPYRLMERHSRLQYNLVYDVDGNCRCDYVGKFENLAEDYLPIQEKNHLHPLRHLNKAGTDDWMNYYTTETATLVYQTFQKDFKTFGYEDSYLELLSNLKDND